MFKKDGAKHYGKLTNACNKTGKIYMVFNDYLTPPEMIEADFCGMDRHLGSLRFLVKNMVHFLDVAKNKPNPERTALQVHYRGFSFANKEEALAKLHRILEVKRNHRSRSQQCAEKKVANIARQIESLEDKMVKIEGVLGA